MPQQLKLLLNKNLEERALARRVSFLIGKNGKILAVFDNRNPAQHLPKMQAAIEAHLN